MDETRTRILTATNDRFRRTGYRGTSMNDVSKAANATIGSIYHFFPGGKGELARAALAESGAAYLALFELIADEATDAVSAVADFFEGAAVVLEESEFVDPCPIGTVAREVANTDDDIRLVAAEVFDSWVDAAATRFRREGLSDTTATAIATTVVAALEGAFVLSRTNRDANRLRIVGRQVTALAAAEIGRVSPA